MLSRQESSLFDPFMMPRYLRLNEAIEQFTSDMVKRDRAVFKARQADIRYVVERQMFFATFPDRALHDYFVACEKHQDLPDDKDLSYWVRQITPYFHKSHPDFDALPNLKSRILRYLYRLRGTPSVRIEGCSEDRPRVLFLVIHPKFVRYLRPIAEKLSVPYAFLAIEDTDMFVALAGQGSPRVHIDLTEESRAMIATEVEIRQRKFDPGPFNSWFIRLNVLRQAFKQLAPDCIVVPEGNAAIYELANQAARAIGIPTVCVQQGWAPVVHPGFRNMSYTKMFVWGQQFIDMLAPYNPRQEFVATGNHIVASVPQGDVQMRSAIAFFLQNGAHWLTEAVAQGVMDLIVWSAEQFPDREIRVREHPGEPLPEKIVEHLKTAKNIRVMLPSEFSLKDVFLDCRVAIAINSTTILEAVASGVVPLILDVGGWGPYYPSVVGEGAGIEANNFADARTELERLVSDDGFCASFGPALDRVRQRLFAHDDNQALEAIVGEIRQIGGFSRSR